jgi:hypothetical protein
LPLKKLFSLFPVVLTLVAVILYFHAASIYPRATPQDAGYRHLDNYWCDLYTPNISGQPNPARPVAMAATVALALALAAFWVVVPALFPAGSLWLARIVRFAGGLAFAIAALIFTPLHDFVIGVGVPLGAVGLVGTCMGLRRQHRVLFWWAVTAAGLCFFDYFLWMFVFLHPQQPAFQKLAMSVFLAWTIAASLAAARRAGAAAGK